MKIYKVYFTKIRLMQRRQLDAKTQRVCECCHNVSRRYRGNFIENADSPKTKLKIAKLSLIHAVAPPCHKILTTLPDSFSTSRVWHQPIGLPSNQYFSIGCTPLRLPLFHSLLPMSVDDRDMMGRVV